VSETRGGLEPAEELVEQHQVELAVRDYECDLQGVVNNAVYLNYLEHARHQYLKALGLDFASLHNRGCDLIALRVEIDYKAPLTSGDHFAIRSHMSRQSRLRFAFDQTIHRLPDGKLMAQGRTIVTGLVHGKLGLPEELLAVLDDS